MKYKLIILFFLICIDSFGQVIPELRYADKIRIREAMNISKQFGDRLFKGYSAVPFAIVLVTDSTEFLINHPNPSSDFTLLGQDDILKTTIYYRKRKFNIRLLATFPAVNGLSCVVMGTPENTGKNSTEWVITLLHEHFHQYQTSSPDYTQSVNALDLSGGDKTGMWMLNYAFPYNSLPVKNQYESFTKALHKAITSIQDTSYKSNLARYITERKKFKDILTTNDYRYFSFQIWQEGLARYTEYNFLEQLVDYSPSKEMVAFPDFMSFEQLKSNMYQAETKNLIERKLDEIQRVCFYAVGFAEGMLLDRLNKSWRKKYLTDKFYIEQYAKKYK